ncbi:MAG TPA: gliding motility-associated C-terminal domain-containing protein [Bacteroidia bacterium]|nr:gliding motility-associated C-terminal domain-containing protein [Bacteroidia bacterium]
MKIKHFLILLLFFTAFCISEKVQASHFAGGDLTYKCVGQDSFRFITKIYRDCSGTAFNEIKLNFEVLAIRSNLSLSKNKMLSIYNRQMHVVNFDCPLVVTSCQINPNFTFGLQEFIFDTTLHLPTFFGADWDSTFCQIYYILSPIGARNNPTNFIGGAMSIHAYINRCDNKINNSPELLNKPNLLVCNGALTSFNVGAIDTLEYDSLSYTLIPPEYYFRAPITFLSGLSIQKPFIYQGMLVFNLLIDSVKGDLKFISTQSQQPSIAVKIMEWRLINGIWKNVGYIIRDMQFYSVQCAPNNAPKVEFFPSTTLQQICQGQSTCFTIRARDPDSAYGHADTTVISWNYSLKGATFSSLNTPVKTVKNDVATVCWTADSSMVKPSPYWMVLRVTDGYCPISSSNAYALGVVVNPNFTVQINRLAQPCQTFRLTALPSRYLYNAAYSWKVCRETNGTYVDSLAQLMASDSVAKLQFKEAGRYIVRLGVTTNGACEKIAYDTLVIDTPMSVLLLSSDTLICKEEKIHLTPVVYNVKGKVSYRYYWGKDSATVAGNYTFTPVSSTQVRVLATDSLGCKNSDSVFVAIDSIPFVNLPQSKVACFGDSVELDAGDNQGKGQVVYNWLKEVLSVGQSQKIVLGAAGKYTVELVYANGCKVSDSTSFIYLDKIGSFVSGDTLVCAGENARLWSSGKTYRWYNIDDTLSYPHLATDSAVSFTVNTNRRVVLHMEVQSSQTTCSAFDTIEVNVKALPTPVVYSQKPVLCCSEFAVVHTQPAGGELFCNDAPFIDSFQVNCASPQRLVYRYTDSVACSNSDTFDVVVQKRIKATVQLNKDTICSTHSLAAQVILNEGVVNSYLWSTNGGGTLSNSTAATVAYQAHANDEPKQTINFTTVLQSNGICPDTTLSSSVHVAPGPQVLSSSLLPDSFCAPGDVRFQLSGIPASQYFWNFGDSGTTTNGQHHLLTTYQPAATHQYLKEGVYSITTKLISEHSCITDYQFPSQVRVFKKPSVYGTIKTTAYDDAHVMWYSPLAQLSDSVAHLTKGERFLLEWQLDGEKIGSYSNSPNSFPYKLKNSTVNYPREWQFLVRIVTEKGCADSFALPTLTLVPPLQVFIPNAFRPASAVPANSKFQIIADNYITANLQIYNRWGQLIFQTNRLDEAWDGRFNGENVMQGIYFYKLTIDGVDGRAYMYSGGVNLLRD